jgi:hypothetical protein
MEVKSQYFHFLKNDDESMFSCQERHVELSLRVLESNIGHTHELQSNTVDYFFFTVFRCPLGYCTSNVC